MRAIPVMVDEDVYAKAEQKAVSLATSLSVVVAEYLRQWVAEGDKRESARALMRKRFANPDWKFSVGALEGREERNARR